MISWHPRPFTGDAKAYAYGWKTADTMDPRRLATCAARFVWSGCLWRGGHRANANFHSSAWCVLDFECPEYPLAEALKAFSDCVHVIGTTRSHGTDKLGIGRPIDCFRVAIPWETPVTDLRTYAHNMSRMVKAYPIDRVARDGARLFFPCKDIVSIELEGYAMRVDEAPPEIPRDPVVPGRVPPWVMWRLARGIPEGERNATAYKIAKDCARAQVPASDIAHLIQGGLRVPLPEKELTAVIASATRAVKAETTITGEVVEHD